MKQFVNKILKDKKLNNNIFEDEELINQLVENYASLIRGICRRFYLVGGTSDDLYQEGMIGLLEAMKHFDESKGTIGDDTFKRFATTCIKRQILDAIKHANTKKNQPLNNSVPIVRKNDEDDEFEIMELGLAQDPEELIISKEKQEERLSLLNQHLSDYEQLVLEFYLDGLNTKTIAKKLNKTPRSITNTIQRIKNKVKQ